MASSTPINPILLRDTLKTIDAALKLVSKSTMTQRDQVNLLGKAWEDAGRTITGSLVNVARQGLIAGGILGATMKTAMSHWNPAAVIRFEQRLGDLSAVVGSILAPAFQDLTDGIYRFSNTLYNLDPQMKVWISNGVKLLVPITALGIALGGLIYLLRPAISIGVTLVGLLAKAWWGVALAAQAATAAQGRAALFGAGFGGGLGAAVGGYAGYQAGGAAERAITGKDSGIGSGLGAVLLGGAGLGVGAHLAAKAGPWIGRAASAAAPYAASAAAYAAPAAGGLTGIAAAGMAATYGIDWMMHPKDPLTLQHFRDAANVDNTASPLSQERQDKNNAIINAERERLGMSPLDASGKQIKDTTGMDAARRATTTQNVTDVGRRMREMALTNAGRAADPNLEQLKQINGKLDDIQGAAKNINNTQQVQGIS